MLLAFGAGALIAVSVLATVYLLRQPAAPSPTGVAAPVVAQVPAVLSPTNAAAPAPEKPSPAPVINAPALALPQTIPPPTPGEIIATTPAPAVAKLPAPPAIAPATVTTPAVATASNPSSSVLPPMIVMPQPPTPSQPALPVLRSFSEGGSLSNPPNGSNGLDPSKPDPKILAYLDALRVAGIRVSDTGSKVLMNDRVYRESEIVDHLLGLRLKKVESDTLTFVDERGVTYTKNF
jgi:hypothetical protein